MSTPSEIRAAIPADLRGRRTHDRTLGLLDRALRGLVGSLRLLPQPPGVPPVRDHRRLVRVAGRYPVSADGTVVAFDLERLDGATLPPWEPGSHIDLTLPSGRSRQYSLCGPANDPSRYRIAVRRNDNGRGGSCEVHDVLVPGAVVEIGVPRNAFPFAIGGGAAADRPIRFVSGGIGITAVLAMAWAAQRMELDWSLVHTGRDRASLPLLDEVNRLGSRAVVRVDDEHGRATASDLLDGVADGSAVYCCGPESMIEAVRAAGAERRGVDVFHERFTPPPIIAGQPFEIEFAHGGEVLAVAADRSALEVMLERDPDLPYSCRQGFCRSCRIGTDDGGDFLPCVDRPAGPRITLDL